MDEWRKKKHQCPCCRDPDATFDPANLVMMNIICNLKFTCINQEKGCEEELFYRDVQRHERMDCMYKKKLELSRAVRWSKRGNACQICT